MLEVKNLHVSVEGKEILRGVDASVKPGEVVVIMGKNGSGKSTLAYTLLGHPKYAVESGSMRFENEEISTMTPNDRANKGMFLANQYPVAVSGLITQSFLWQVFKKRNGAGKTNIISFRKWIQDQAKELDLNQELLTRSLNEGFSGGEKKKLEILQMLVSNPKLVILDEIDSGLDVDALKKIAQTVAKVAKDMKIGVMIITHYNRILKYLIPDKVIIMEDGKVVRSGGSELAEVIESQGYQNE